MDEKKNESQKNSDSKLMAALSYLWLVSILMYMTKKNDDFIMFHAKQGIVLFVFSFVVFVLSWIPLLGIILWLAYVIASILGFIKAFSGEKYKMPVVGDLAAKF